MSTPNLIDLSFNNTPPKDLPFWSENPNILFQFPYITEIFPVDAMSYNQNLNAISRLVILFTFIGFIFTKNIRLLFIGAITLFSIYILYYMQLKKKESFKDAAQEFLKDKIPSYNDTFMSPTTTNPFSNVLISDYDYNPNKKPAPPSFNIQTNNDILENAKKMVSDLNPDQPDIADKLFRDLGEQYVFEQSLRPFYSTASTTIPNDQQAFAEFCYGSMISCKEGNPFACARNLSRYTNV
jgi:hypothetical protein